MSAVHKRGHNPRSSFHVFVNAFARCRTPAYPAHPDGPMQTHEVLLQILSAGEDGSIKSHSCGPIKYSAAPVDAVEEFREATMSDKSFKSLA